MIKSTIRQYYILLALSQAGIGIIAATYVTFLLSRGLNLFEVNLVNVAFFVTLFLCEIPTGAFADVFGRKMSYVLSCTLFAVSMFVYASSESLSGFILAEVIGAIGATFASGAFDAWLVDTLKHHGYSDSIGPIFSRKTQIKYGVLLVVAIAGAFIADISIVLPWIVGGCLFSLSTLFALFTMKEEYFERKKLSFRTGLTALKDTVRASIEYGIRNSNVRFVMMMTLVLAFAVMAPNMQWQPYFKNWLPDQTSMGFIFAGVSLSIVLGGWIAPKILSRITDERTALVVCLAVIGGGMLGSVAFIALPPVVFFFLLHEVGRGAFDPIKQAYLHDNIPSKERATVVSFESIAHHLGGIVGLLVSGLLAQHGSIELAWIVSGMSLILVALAFWGKGLTQRTVS